MWVLADVKSGKLWKLGNDIVANVNPPMIWIEVYPTGHRARFVTVLTAVRRVQAHPSSQDRSYTNCNSRYSYRLLHSSTKQDHDKV